MIRIRDINGVMFCSLEGVVEKYFLKNLLSVKAKTIESNDLKKKVLVMNESQTLNVLYGLTIYLWKGCRIIIEE